MKTIILLAILGVLGFTALEYHQASRRELVEHNHQAVDSCFQDAVQLGGIGADTCKDLANRMIERGDY